MVTKANDNRQATRRRIDFLLQDLLDLYDQRGILEQVIFTLKLIKTECKIPKVNRRNGLGRRKIDRAAKTARVYTLVKEI